MFIDIDLHTHTIRSGHAYSTLEEYVAFAARSDFGGFAVTDHGPAMEDCPGDIYFINQTSIPRWMDGVFILRGAEANILDFEGAIDLSIRALKRIDICIASFHDICIQPGTSDQHTTAWEAIIANPLIDILGHPGRGEFPFDIDHVVRQCEKGNKLVEINNHTLDFMKNHDTCRKIALACMKYGTSIVVNSDAHISRSVGRVDHAEALLAEINFPEELILNKSREKVTAYLQDQKPHLKGL